MVSTKIFKFLSKVAIEHWFDQKWISDWNVCDWLCVRLLSPVLDQDPEPTLKYLLKWNKSDYLWKARASLVPFAESNSLEQHYQNINPLSLTLIQREERFAKTAVGWVLRQISKFDQEYVKNFLEENAAFITPEVKKNATKYF